VENTQNSLMDDPEGSGQEVSVLSFLNSGVQTVICLSSSGAALNTNVGLFLMVPVRARERCLRFSVHEMHLGQGVLLPHHCCVHRLFNVRISDLHLAHIC
jgi:hypothetical protein